jgi:type IV pilus assembly protein PilV
MNRIPPRRRAASAGFMLFEVLVAVLIFSLGVLAIVGLMTFSVKQTTGAKYRADASLLANDLIGRMWVGDRSFATLQAGFDTTGVPGQTFNDWLTTVQATLPGAVANPPIVRVQSVAAGASGVAPTSQVTVTVRWKPPNEPASDPVHTLSFVTRIR